MKNTHKVTYTLQKEIVKIINYYSDYLSMSKKDFVSLCIEDSFLKLDDELKEFRDGDFESFYDGTSKKYDSVTPQTFSISKDILEKVNYYSFELGLKKSHIVRFALYYMHIRILKYRKGFK